MDWQPSIATAGEGKKGDPRRPKNLCSSYRCIYRPEKKTDLQIGKSSCCVEKPRRQCLKRVEDVPADWFRMQNMHIGVFVAQKIRSSKAVIGLANSMHRRQLILRILLFFSFPIRFHLLVFSFYRLCSEIPPLFSLFFYFLPFSRAKETSSCKSPHTNAQVVLQALHLYVESIQAHF